MKFSIECSNVDHTLINCVGISAGLTKKKPIQKKQGNLYAGEERRSTVVVQFKTVGKQNQNIF